VNRFDLRLVNRPTVFVAASAVFSAVIGLSGVARWTFHLASQLFRRAVPLTIKVNAVASLVGLFSLAKHLSLAGLVGDRLSMPRAADPDIDRKITGRNQTASAFAAQATELERFDQALQSQTVLLQCLLDSIGEGLVAADEHGKLFLWNPAAEKIIGMGMAIIPCEQWAEHYGFYMPGTLTPFPVEQIPLARAIQGEANTKAEIFVRNLGRPEGALIETNAQPLRDKNGALRGGVIAIRDSVWLTAPPN
jgi:PAS domain-containing protein